MKSDELMTTLELLEEAKSLNGNATDYRIAKILGVKRATISSWRTRGTIPDDETAVKLAEALNMQPEYVLACVHAERCSTPQARTAWAHIAAAFGTAALVVITLAPHLHSIQF